MSRKSILSTASKITLFLLLVLAVRPSEAVEYHIGTTGTNTATDIYYANLDALRIAVSNRTTDGLKDGDFITLYGDDHSLTDELYVGYNVSITFRSSDPEQRRTVTPAAGAQTRFMYMDGTGSTRWSKIYFEGIEEMSGFDDRGSSSSGGGIIYAWWNQYIYTLDGKGVTFKDNFSQTGTGGGVVYYWDAIECDFTDSNFIDNSTTGAGGALFINASTTLTMTDHTDITIGASDGNVSTFRGNRAYVNYDGTGGYSNSIDFTGGANNTANLYIKTEGTGVLDMQDPFRTQAGFGGNYYVNIIKTGTGTWKLGGDSVVAGSSGTKIEIQEGTLEFYRGASLSADGANDSFAVKKDARVLIVGENRIQGSKVTFEEGSLFAFDMNFYFTTPPDGGSIPTKDTHMLELAGGLNINKAAVDILNLPTDDSRKGDYTLVLSDKDIQGDDFTLLFNGAVIETTASDRLGYGLRIPEAAKNTLVLHVGDTFNTVLTWNNQDTAHSGQWSYDGVNWYDPYVKLGNESFIPNDTVIFDLASGGTIELVGIMTVSKDAGRHSGDHGTIERGIRISGNGDWTFNGGAIADAYSITPGEVSGPEFLAALVFDGTGTLALNNDSANTYHDGTYISGGGTIIANGANSLGSSKFAGSPTTGRTVPKAPPSARRVQAEGYGVVFSKSGGTIQFLSGSTLGPETAENVWDQRIRVENSSKGVIRFEKANQDPLVVSASSIYGTYAPDLDGGAVNVGNGGEFQAIGNIVFARNASVDGLGGAIKAGNNATIVLDGTKSSNGMIFIENEAQSGGAVYAGNSATVDAVNVTYQANEATDGGAVYLGDRGTYMATGNIFQGNKASERGGAVFAGLQTGLFIDASQFHSNEAVRGGAVYHLGNTTTTPLALSFQNTVFGSITVDPDVANTGNVAEDGGAIFINSGRYIALDATGSRFYANEATTGSGGAVYVDAATRLERSALVFNGAIFEANSAQRSGGAVYLTDFQYESGADRETMNRNQYFQAIGSTFTKNEAVTGDGGAIRGGQSAFVRVSGTTSRRSTFTDNDAANFGGAIYVGLNGEIQADYTDFIGNTADSKGGAVYIGGANNTASSFFRNSRFAGNTVTGRQGEGGAIYSEDGVTIDVTGSKFHDNGAPTGIGNAALYGGAIRLGSQAVLHGDNTEFLRNRVLTTGGRGGAVYVVSHGTLSLKQSVFKENEAADSGGAIAIGQAAPGTTLGYDLNLSGATLEDNVARYGDGGAVYAAQHNGPSVILANDVMFRRNRAGADGGAVRVSSGTATDNLVLNFDKVSKASQFIENTAGRSGGAVYGDDYVELRAADTTFQGNTAALHGGAVRLGDHALVTIDQATFAGNTLGGATGQGGAIYAGDDAKITGKSVTFRSNGTAVPADDTLPTPKTGLYGGAIRVGNNAVLDFNLATFTQNHVNATNSRGGAIYAGTDSDLNLVKTVFRQNSAQNAGGAIYAESGAMIDITEAQFIDNTAAIGRGGAIYLTEGSEIILEAAKFTGNTADIDGGAIYGTTDVELSGTGVQFTDNAATKGSGGAIRLGNSAEINLPLGRFIENTAKLDGGAIYVGADAMIDVSGTSKTLTAIFTSNTAGRDGGAIWVGENAERLAFRYATFTTNTAGGEGGAIRVGNGAGMISFENASFLSNTAVGHGGAVRAGNTVMLVADHSSFTLNTSGASGGAVKLGNGATILMTETSMTRNTADGAGGALQTGTNGIVILFETQVNVNAAGRSGGAFELGNGSVLATINSEFTDNRATLNGGAVSMTGTTSNQGRLDFDTTTFRSNAALEGHGGAVYATHTELVQNVSSQFVSNTAAGHGGALYAGVGTNASNFDLTGTTFISNIAELDGGALYFVESVGLGASNSVFASNTARSGAAIHAAAGGTMNLDYAEFDGNGATTGHGGAILFGSDEAASTIVGNGTIFIGNEARGGSGGALYTVDTDLDFTNAVFDNNTAARKGGAILYETTGGERTIRFAAETGMTSTFSGNTAADETSSIHFIGTGEFTTIEMQIATDVNGVFELYDAMHIDDTHNLLKLDITKTGAGTWLLGNIHDLRTTDAGSTVRFEEGFFELENGAALLLTNVDENDTFTMLPGTVLVVRGENEIAATSITVTDEMHFDLNGTLPDSDTVALTLTGMVDTASGNAIGSGNINIIDFVQQTGTYNLVKAEDGNLTDTGTLYYKGVQVSNNDRLMDFWDLTVDRENATLQIELRPWANTEMTWTGAVDNYWNVEKRNWAGVSEGVSVDQFIDGDSVYFRDAGAGTINVSPNDVVVGDMMIDSKKNYVFQGGTVTGNLFQKFGSGSLEMKNLFLFDTLEVYDGKVTGGRGGNWSFVGTIDFKNGSVFAPSDKFRVDGNINLEGGSRTELILGKTQNQSSAVMASGTIDFGGAGGNATIRIENNSLNSGQYGMTGPILIAEGGLTLGDEIIGDGTYGMNRRVILIGNGTQSVSFESDRSLALQAAVIGSDSTELSLIAFGTGFGAKGPTSKDFNRNQMAVYVALENAPYLSLANTFFAEVAKLGSVEEKAEALDGLLSTVNSASMLVVERSIVRATTTLYDRLHLLNEVRYADRNPSTRGQVPSHGGRLNLSPWFTQLGDFAYQDDSREAPGFDSKMYGFMLGVDRRYSQDLIIGFGLGGTFASVDSGRYQSGRANSFMATLYGSYNYNDWTVAANAGVAGSEYTYKRRIFTVASESKLHGFSVFGGLELSKMFRTDFADVMPYASLQLVTLDVGSWKDSSLGLAGGVKIDSGDSSAVLQTFGAKFGKAFTGARGATWTPAVTLGWIHDYGRGRLRSTMTYGGSTPFMVVGAERVRDRALAGLSTNVAFRRINVFASYDSEFSGRFSSHTIQTGLNLTF